MANSDIFRHIHIHSDIFSYIVAYLEPCVILAYSEPCHIQNPGMFRTRDIVRTLSRHILAYSKCCVTLSYWELCHIQNFVIFRILAYLGLKAYSESCLYRHIQVYSGISNNDSCNHVNFIFFTLIFHTFQRHLKIHVFWLQWRQFQFLAEST